MAALRSMVRPDHTKSAAWRAPRPPGSVIATIIGAWVGGGLADRSGRAPVTLISGVVGGVAMASIPPPMPLAPPNTGLIACVVLGAAFDDPVGSRRTVSCPNSATSPGSPLERLVTESVIGNVAI